MYKILLIVCLMSSQVICFSQNPRLILNTSNTPLYTLFSPMTYARNSTTITTAIPALAKSSAGNTLTLTNGTTCAGVAATFNNTFNPAKDWQLRFTYTLTSAGGAATNADGISIAIHNDARGTAAVGGSGSSLGSDVSDVYCANVATAIRKAMLWQFEIFSGAGNYGATLKTTNNTPTVSTVSGPSFISPVAINTNIPIDITMRYVASSTTLTVTLSDGTNTKTFTYTVNLSSVVGTTGYLAFTASTGGSVSTQTISKVFMFGYPQ